MKRTWRTPGGGTGDGTFSDLWKEMIHNMEKNQDVADLFLFVLEGCPCIICFDHYISQAKWSGCCSAVSPSVSLLLLLLSLLLSSPLDTHNKQDFGHPVTVSIYHGTYCDLPRLWKTTYHL